MHYLALIVAVVVAILVVKKVASCLIRSVVLLALAALAAYVWYMYIR